MYSYWTIFIVRSLVYGYFGLDYARHDPIFGVFHRLIGNRFLGVFLSSYILSYLAVDYLFYLAPNRLSGATLKELLLDLKFKNLIIPTSKFCWTTTPLTSPCRLVNRIRSIWRGTSSLLQPKLRLLHFRHLSAAQQQRCALFCQLITPLVTSYCALRSYAAIITSLVICKTYFTVNPLFSLQSAVFLIDHSFMLAIGRRTYVNMYYSMLHFLTTTFALYCGATEATQTLKRDFKKGFSNELTLIRSQARFRRLHSTYLIDLVTFNACFASLFLFTNILPVVVGDIYNLSELNFGNSERKSVALLISGIIFQSLKLLLLQFLPVVSEALYGAQKTLFNCQLKVRDHLREKIKLMYYCEVMAPKEPATFSAGTYGKITKKWLLEQPKIFINAYIFRADSGKRWHQNLLSTKWDLVMLSYGLTFLLRSLLYSISGGPYTRFDGYFWSVHRLVNCNHFIGAVFASYSVNYIVVDYLLYLAPNRFSASAMKELLIDLTCPLRCISYYSAAVFVLDMSLNLAYTRRTFLNMFYSMLHFATVTFALYSGSTEATRTFKRALVLKRSGSCSPVAQKMIHSAEAFRQLHSKLLIDLITFDSRFASLFIFSSILPVVVGDIYNGSVLVFEKHDSKVDFYLVLSGIVFQSLKLLLLQYLPAVSETLYGGQQALYDCQLQVKGHLKDKIKLMTYHELMATQERVTFNAGTYGKITKKWLLDVSNVLQFYF
ncbi:hypothetical protein TYRP_011926 [Tyrophagus putrescentiae]|nr:hypothetical protein TYRP_011926 [Tyrophagus putrescentiae]